MNRKTLFSRSLIVIAAALAIASCSGSGSSVKRAAIAKPFKNADVAVKTFQIDPTKDETVRLPSGTQITIPANTLADASGRIITTSVSLRYREFHSPAEIIASGITMNYDSGGTTHSFKSAGMFEMGAVSNNQEVYIKKGGNIHVDLASYTTDGTYNFYKLDTATADWSYLNTTVPAPNALRKETETQLATEAEPVKPAEPSEYDGKASVFDLDFDPASFPGLSGYKGVMWQFADASEEAKNQWVYDTDWKSAILVPGDEASGSYTMRLTASKKIFSATVKPVLSGTNFKEALASFREKVKTWEAGITKRDLRRQELLNMAAYQRSVNIGSFGTYNCDHIHYESAPMVIEPQFRYTDEEFSNNPDLVTLYMIIGDDKTPIRYSAANPYNFYYAADKANRIVAVLEGSDKASVIKADVFMKQASSRQFNFGSTTSVASLDELKNLLNNL